MPYASVEKRREAVRRYKATEKYKARRRELYRLSHPKRQPVSAEHKRAVKSAKDRRYRVRYAEQLRGKKARYYQANKKKIHLKLHLRYHSDAAFRLTCNLRSRLKSAIRNELKAGSAVRDLGCSIHDFKAYLEERFLPGMSWDNYGSWHIDHIVPLCDFDLSRRQQVKEACHYTNLQPLWARHNLQKNRYPAAARSTAHRYTKIRKLSQKGRNA